MSDFGGIGGIIKEAQALDEAAKRPPVACPRCGTPLDVNARGERNCPLGHYRTVEAVPA